MTGWVGSGTDSLLFCPLDHWCHHALPHPFSSTNDPQCAQVVTVMSDRGWHTLFACNKYSGSATRWDSVYKTHVTAVSAMGKYR